MATRKQDRDAQSMVADHKKWLESGGQPVLRANLQEADLGKACLAGANLQRAYMQGANLRGADLRGANLRRAHLEGANLEGANLRGADLRAANAPWARLVGADLRDADLQTASLQRANLQGAYLQGVNLRGADLEGADLQGTDLEGVSLARANPVEITLPTGETVQEFIDEVVPVLLTAGGKTLEEIVATGAWEHHDWSNNPVAVAFDCDWPTGTGVPMLLRPRADQFFQLFNAGLIPCPVLEAEPKDAE